MIPLIFSRTLASCMVITSKPKFPAGSSLTQVFIPSRRQLALRDELCVAHRLDKQNLDNWGQTVLRTGFTTKCKQNLDNWGQTGIDCRGQQAPRRHWELGRGRHQPHHGLMGMEGNLAHLRLAAQGQKSHHGAHLHHLPQQVGRLGTSRGRVCCCLIVHVRSDPSSDFLNKISVHHPLFVKAYPINGR